MKTLFSCTFILICSVLLLGTGTTKQQSPSTNIPIEDINIQVGEYPPPLDINGRYKYHVVVNDTIIGMTNEDVAELMEKYKIKPRGREAFHQLNTGRYGIWAHPVITPVGGQSSASAIVNK